MNPYVADSPSARMAPSVSSPSLLAREARAPQPLKRVVRPFLLRSTTPLGPAQPAVRPSDHAHEHGSSSASKLSRSKTESALNPPQGHSTSRPAPLNRPLAAPGTASTTTRRSSRPAPNPSTRTHTIRASRKITFVPDPASPPPAASTAPRPLAPSSSSSAAQRLQAVEKRKMELKRESLMSRRHSMTPPGRATSSDENAECTTSSDSSTRRWALRPVRESMSRKPTASVATAFPAPPDSPSPSPSPLSLAHRHEDLDISDPSPLARRPAIRGPGVRRSGSSSQLRKTESYLELSRVPKAGGNNVELEKSSGVEKGSTRTDAALQRSRTGYTSLQEILAERGYQDTRVVTPNSKVRAKKPEPVATSLLAAPPSQVREKSSMLSLRGLFSLWGTSGESQGADEGKEPTALAEVEAEEPPSPNGSGGTFTQSPITRAREWAEGVAIATAKDQDNSLATLKSASFTPPFQYSLSATDDSPTSSRSYSSSIVTASSIRSPPQVTIALPASTVALSPPCFHRFPSTLSPPKSNAVKTLRHVVSDSTLPQLLPHYTSFPFSPSSCESSDTSEPSPAVHQLLSPLQPCTASPSPRSPVLGVQTSWLPSLLRHRASQVFSLPVVGLGLTSSTPLFPQPQQFSQQQSGIARTMKHAATADKRKPKLLRKAVSSAGLVRPVLTTTNY